jgi:hypothetical protein
VLELSFVLGMKLNGPYPLATSRRGRGKFGEFL